jgi:hypothetical protein
MGREIRRVPPNWEHPTYRDLGYDEYGAPRWGKGIDEHHPLYDRNYEEKAEEWLKNLATWQAGEDEAQKRNLDTPKYYWDWDGGPPNEKYYRTGKWVFTPEEATCYQMYQTVSEGTPTSPVFETLEALEDWLVGEGHSREAAHRFAESGWAPSGVFVPRTGFVRGIEGLAALGVPGDGE